ncbi:hypothetical protein THRCLA_06680 [Thraustotheca clavata]|uniref:Transmembrane protein n=1 Tax=Thraustotheca clavata TaxID=74557 RepID=A0A1V9ZLB4_9STRA|nr:hypothetical protein THRCLA_06680 [Thraustotheca clavata]
MLPAWVHERAALIVLSVLSLLLVTVYVSSVIPWLSKDVPVPSVPYKSEDLSAIERRLLASGVQWELSLWRYCIAAHTLHNATTVCTLWKEACDHHTSSSVCQSVSSLQTLAFLSLSFSIFGLYVAYRTVAHYEVPRPSLALWCMAIRVCQIGLETGMVLIVLPMRKPSLLFPYGLEIGAGVLYCFAHMCCTLGIAGVSLLVFLRIQTPPRHEYVLFQTVESP